VLCDHRLSRNKCDCFYTELSSGKYVSRSLSMLTLALCSSKSISAVLHIERLLSDVSIQARIFHATISNHFIEVPSSDIWFGGILSPHKSSILDKAISTFISVEWRKSIREGIIRWRRETWTVPGVRWWRRRRTTYPILPWVDPVELTLQLRLHAGNGYLSFPSGYSTRTRESRESECGIEVERLIFASHFLGLVT